MTFFKRVGAGLQAGLEVVAAGCGAATGTVSGLVLVGAVEPLTRTQVGAVWCITHQAAKEAAVASVTKGSTPDATEATIAARLRLFAELRQASAGVTSPAEAAAVAAIA